MNIQFKCPKCGRKHDLDESWRNKVAQCQCDAIVRVPSRSEGPVVMLKRCPACGTMCPMAQRICFKCGYDFETGKIDRFAPDKK